MSIPANDPDGYPLGAMKKGNVVSLQYVTGKWKNHGKLATKNPDDVKGAAMAHLSPAVW